MSQRLAPAACALTLALSAAACGSAGDTADPGSAAPAASEPTAWEVRPVDMPDLSLLPESVQAQVRTRFATLAAVSGRPNASARELAQAHGDIGLILMATRFHTGAEASLRNAEALLPRDPRWPYYLGQLFLLTGDPARAVEPFERALDLRPADLPTIVRLGEAYLDRDRAADAERLFTHGQEIAPESAAVLEGLGRARLALDDPAGAVELLERVLALDPQATRVHYRLALAYRGLGDQERAERHLGQRGDGRPRLRDPLMQDYFWLLESADAYNNRGRLAMEAEDYQGAVEMYRRGLELDPDSAELRHGLGLALYWIGDGSAAVAEFQEALRRTPDHAPTHLSLAIFLAQQRRFRDALTHFAAAAEHDPAQVDAHVGQAEMLRNLGDLAASVVHWRQVVTLDPTDAASWTEGAMALVRLERYEDARAWLAEARERHPEHPGLGELAGTVAASLAAR
ncbi:MAG: tetratricopeptide repeat protein [Acidobacteria bacterium]|nr:tetratricopeptide repeat protein [Acidobacteriota bacterium]